jgi:hypothetical protein
MREQCSEEKKLRNMGIGGRGKQKQKMTTKKTYLSCESNIWTSK